MYENRKRKFTVAVVDNEH